MEIQYEHTYSVGRKLLLRTFINKQLSFVRNTGSLIKPRIGHLDLQYIGIEYNFYTVFLKTVRKASTTIPLEKHNSKARIDTYVMPI